MINNSSVSALKKAQWTSQFNKPLYENYAFSCIPETVKKLLTGKGKNTLAEDTVGSWDQYDCVVLFLIDAFGWEFYERFFERYPFLGSFAKQGVASKISSQFPSTTAAHVTSINSGLEVGETGIYEWFHYEPLADRMIAPLLFSTAGDQEIGTLLKEGFSPEQIFPFETIYQKFAKQGIKSIIMQQQSIAHSPYSNAMLAGAEMQPFVHFHEALDSLVKLCQAPVKQKTYILVYFGDIDSMGHRHGIHSPQFTEAVDYCWGAVENRFWRKLSSCPNKTAVIFTADHGMTAVDPKKTHYLNRLMPELPSMVRKNKAGNLLAPAGSCRDFFLHVEDKHLAQAHSALQRHLKGVGEVVLVEELMKMKFFGNKSPSKRLKERIGNLLVLPYPNESVFWWFEKHRFEQHFYGAHGGLTPSEIESLFLFLPLGK